MVAGLQLGLAAMAALAIYLRQWGHPNRRAILRPLIIFQLLLAGIALFDGLNPDALFGFWELFALPLPFVIRWHLDVLAQRPARRRDWAWGLILILTLPYFALPDAQQTNFWENLTNDTADDRQTFAAITLGIFAIIMLFVTMVLTLQITRQWIKHRQFLRQLYAGEEDRSRFAARLLVSAPAIVFVGYICSQLIALTQWTNLALQLDELIMTLAIIAIGAHGLSIESLPSWAREVKPFEPTPKYKNSGLDQTELARILARLDEAVGQGRLWENPALTLQDLAEAARSKPHYISQALNQGRGMTFFGFINEQRITAAAQMLTETDSNILEICYDVGFNSKSTFNAAFMKIKGETPSAWRKRSRSEPTGTVAS